jgi:hypothetical protein
MNAAATEKRALNGIPSANLQMCGFFNNWKKVFFVSFFGVLECVVIIMLQFERKKPIDEPGL